MQRILSTILFVLFAFTANADDIMANLSGKISESVAGMIPGEGITEVDIKVTESKEPSYSILTVRDISKTEDTNFFSQFSLSNSDVGSDERLTANVGFGYRFLSDDESAMFGLNSFFDTDLTAGHRRASVGLEAKGAVFDFNLNRYMTMSETKKVEGTDEQVVGGTDWSLFSQIPYMPWAKIGWTGYSHLRDKASKDVAGNIYTMNMALSPTMELNVSRDKDNSSDAVTSASLTFVYPPKDDRPTLADGFTSDEIWHKESMKEKLSAKVRRKNNLTVEVQGAVIFTKK